MKISFSRRYDYEDIDIETGGSGSDEMEGTADGWDSLRF